MKQTLLALALSISPYLQACDICDYLHIRGAQIFYEINDKSRAEDYDSEFYMLIGQMYLIAELADHELLHYGD